MKLALIFIFCALILIPNAYAQEVFDEEYVDFIVNHIDTINELLVQTDEEYTKGNKDLAMKLATIAYIDHYEFIEFELGQYNEELIKDVEWAMREELRGMIRDEASPKEVSQKINEIQEKLKDIATIVPEFGILTIMILSISILATVILAKKIPNFGIR
jgi:predicted secreted protein with PEFG-CTERM motif